MILVFVEANHWAVVLVHQRGVFGTVVCEEECAVWLVGRIM